MKQDQETRGTQEAALIPEEFPAAGTFLNPVGDVWGFNVAELTLEPGDSES